MNSNEHRIESLCIRNCCLDNDNICLGCFRSIDEITGWSQANEVLRKQYIDNGLQRGKAYKQKSNNRCLAAL